MNRRAYPSDRRDEEWAILEPLLPEGQPGGRPRRVAIREIVNGILYLPKRGGGWRRMPNDRPKWETVYSSVNRWRRRGVWSRINSLLRAQVRQADGRERSPSAAILDSQRVQTTAKGAGVATTLASASKGANDTASSRPKAGC